MTKSLRKFALRVLCGFASLRALFFLALSPPTYDLANDFLAFFEKNDNIARVELTLKSE